MEIYLKIGDKDPVHLEVKFGTTIDELRATHQIPKELIATICDNAIREDYKIRVGEKVEFRIPKYSTDVTLKFKERETKFFVQEGTTIATILEENREELCIFFKDAKIIAEVDDEQADLQDVIQGYEEVIVFKEDVITLYSDPIVLTIKPEPPAEDEKEPDPY